MIKENRAITLIALVVIIIVLIMLAGLSLNLLFGDNGILTKTHESVKLERIAQKEEEVSMAIASVIMDNLGDYSKVTISAVLDEIRKNYSDQDKSKIVGESTGGKENHFPGVITYIPPTSGLSENIIITVGEDLKPKGSVDESEPDEYSNQPTIHKMEIYGIIHQI